MDSKNNLNESLGFLIKEKRKLKGFTQSELAKLCGISTRHVGKLENGIYIPRLSTYLKLSTILELNIENIKTIQKYTPRKTEAKILHLLRNCTEAELELCLRLIETVKNSINTERRKKHA